MALLLLSLTVAALPAQEITAAAGYVSTKGRIGDSRSTHGPAVRLGVNFPSGSHLVFGLEGGLDFLNEARFTSQSSCVLPGGGTGTCHFDTRNTDVGRSLAGLVRFGLPGSRVSPYILLGLGILSTRTHSVSRVTDQGGNELDNFSGDFHSHDDAIQGPFGAGVVLGPRDARLRVVIEGRGTALLHNYSGGLQLDVSPSATVGVRWRP